MEKKPYLTVKELAELTNVSVQAIYKRMGTDLKPYVEIVENKKCLKIEVLRYLSLNHSTKKVESLNVVETVEFKTLAKLVEVLEKENELKQQTIEMLNQKLEEEHQQLIHLSGQVGNTLQAITQGQLAEKLIEGKKLADAPEEKKGFFQRLFSPP